MSMDTFLRNSHVEEEREEFDGFEDFVPCLDCPCQASSEDDCIDCGNGRDFCDEPQDQFMSDIEADADALNSAGFGTDEDYGYFGDDY